MNVALKVDFDEIKYAKSSIMCASCNVIFRYRAVENRISDKSDISDWLYEAEDLEMQSVMTIEDMSGSERIDTNLFREYLMKVFDGLRV